jgi:L-asparaginase II
LDGATRAAETAMAAIIARFLPLSEMERGALALHTAPLLHNWNGAIVGQIRASSALKG